MKRAAFSKKPPVARYTTCMALTLVKLGGSSITDKTTQNTARPEVIEDLLAQIAQARAVWQAARTGQQLILAHGQGSFAHFPAKQYEITQGFIRPDSTYGMAVVLAAVADLNHRVIEAGLKLQLPVVPWFAAQSVITQRKQAKTVWLDVLKGYLAAGLLPVTTGDMVLDTAQGCAVWSGENVLNYLAETLTQQKQTIAQVIQVGEVAGVLDSAGAVIPVITPESWQQYQNHVTSKTRGTDVTGGMLKKVEESLQLLKKTGIETWIIDGFAPQNLLNALTGKHWIGTRIARE